MQEPPELNIASPNISTESGSESQLVRGTALDLLYYFLGGIGLYLLASLLVGVFVDEITLGVTLLAILLNFIFLAGCVYFLGIQRKKISWESMGFRPARPIGYYALLGIGLTLAILPVRLLAGLAGVWIEKLVTGEISSLAGREALLTVGMDTWYGVLLMLVGVGVLAPIAEELFFRGLLYGWFRQRMGIWLSVFASSLLFGLAHFDSLSVVGSSFIMGLVMAAAYEYSRSLWVTIFMHIATNSGAVLLMALFTRFQDWIPLT